MKMVKLACIGILAAAMVGGCASYATPGRGADLSSIGVNDYTRKGLTDPQVGVTLDKKPLARFPTSIALVRIQAPEYRSRSVSSFGTGQYSIVTTRDVETDEQFARIAKLPMIAGLAPMNRLLFQNDLESDLQLREAAAKLHADMLLIYTFDTSFYNNQMAQPLNVVSLGLSPTKTIRVTTTVSAVLMDTRNGYIYGLAESSGTRNKLTNVWMSQDMMDDARKNNEKEAFEKLVGEFEKTWGMVVNQYAVSGAE